MDSEDNFLRNNICGFDVLRAHQLETLRPRSKRETLDYQLTLEKAVLEYAGSAAARMKTRPDKYVQIPGYPDVHVWGMATQLHETGFLTALVPSDRREVGITEISETGSERLKTLRAQAAQFEEQKKADLDAKIEASRQARLQKKWWRRLLGKSSASA